MTTELVARLRKRADEICDNDCAVIEAGGPSRPWTAENERLMRQAADEIERLLKLQRAYENLIVDGAIR